MSLSKNIHRIPIRRRNKNQEESAERSDLEQAKAPVADTQGEPSTSERKQSARPTVQEDNTTAQSETTAWRERALHLKAELDHCYARQDERVATLVTEEQRTFLRSFLPIVDNLEQALAHMQRDDPLHEGVQATYEGMLNLLARHNVEPLVPVGKPFDPEVHEAASVVTAPPTQQEPLRVVEQIRSGYTWNDRLLRPARVVVAKHV